MSLDKALKIVKEAMTDRSVYDAVAARENEVWGTILPALENSQAKMEDATATEKLNANRHQSYLIGVAREKNLRFQHGLTIGCGAGRLERALLKEGICSSFHGIDISEKATCGFMILLAKCNGNMIPNASQSPISCWQFYRRNFEEIKSPTP